MASASAVADFKHYLIDPAVVVTNVGSQVLLFDRVHDRFFALSASASLIWRAIQSHATQQEFHEALRALFDGAPADEELLRDVEAVLESLLSHRLTVRAGAGPGVATFAARLVSGEARMRYEPPSMREISTEYLKKARPATYYRTVWGSMGSDTWGPAGGNVDEQRAV